MSFLFFADLFKLIFLRIYFRAFDHLYFIPMSSVIQSRFIFFRLIFTKIFKLADNDFNIIIYIYFPIFILFYCASLFFNTIFLIFFTSLFLLRFFTTLLFLFFCWVYLLRFLFLLRFIFIFTTLLFLFLFTTLF